jgi:hypothetical protein
MRVVTHTDSSLGRDDWCKGASLRHAPQALSPIRAPCRVTTASHRLHHGYMDAPATTPELAAVVGSTFAGTVLGAAAAGLLLGREWSYDGPDLSIPIIFAMYVLDAALVVVCALLALYVRYRSVPDIRTGMFRVGVGLVAGGLVSLVPAIAFASSTGYSSQRGAQEAEVAIVAACCLLGIAGGALAWVSTRCTSP